MKLNNYDEDERTLRTHLSLIHGVYVGDVKSLAGLREAHDASHDDPDPHFVLNHSHDEGWYCEEGIDGVVTGQAFRSLPVLADIDDDDFDDGYFT